MATCCFVGRSRPLLISLGLIGGLFVLTALSAWLATMLVGLVVLAPAAAVSRGARRRWRQRVRALAVTLQVSRQKLHETLEVVAPRTRSRIAGSLMGRSPAAAGFVYRHFVGLGAGVLAALGGVSYAVIRVLVA